MRFKRMFLIHTMFCVSSSFVSCTQCTCIVCTLSQYYVWFDHIFFFFLKFINGGPITIAPYFSAFTPFESIKQGTKYICLRARTWMCIYIFDTHTQTRSIFCPLLSLPACGNKYNCWLISVDTCKIKQVMITQFTSLIHKYTVYCVCTYDVRCTYIYIKTNINRSIHTFTGLANSDAVN